MKQGAVFGLDCMSFGTIMTKARSALKRNSSKVSSDFGNQILANREPSPVASPTYESMKTADPSTLCARPPLPPFNSAVKHLKHQTFQSIPSPNHKPYNIYLPRSPKPATFNSPAPPKKRKPSKDSVIGIRSEACRSYAP